MDFNDAQKRAIENEQSLVVISAGAGSGKTRVLTERMMYLLEKNYLDQESSIGATIEEIAAITFTEKAAREMKDRVRKRLSEKVDESETAHEASYWSEQKELVERAHISTFHSFCQQLLGQHAIAAKLPPKIRIIDDLESRQLKRDVLKKQLQDVEFTAVAKEFFHYMSKDQLIVTIEEIHAAVSELVVGEDAILELQPEEMLRAQVEAILKKQQEKVQAFHQVATQLIQELPSGEGLTKAQFAHVERLQEAFAAPMSTESPNDYIKWLQEVMPKRTDKKWQDTLPSLFQLFEGYWKPLKEEWKSIGGDVVVEEKAAHLLNQLMYLLGKFHLSYKKEKNYRGVVDFSDLQQKAVSLLTNSAIQKAVQKQFRHMLVDEFQDTNRLQLEMLNQIQPHYRFIVGDTKQSIYRFRGANVRLMNELEAVAKEQENADAIDMNINYRTCKPIIDGINALFASAMTDEITESYQTRYTALDAHRQPEISNQKQIELLVLQKEEEEVDSYDQLANRITEIIHTKQPRVFKEGSWQAPDFKDIAVLIPARTELLQLERAFLKKQVPYTVYGGVGFYDRQEVVDIITFLKWLNRPFEDVYLLSILRSPLIGLTMNDFLTISEQKETVQSFADYIYNWSEQDWDAPTPIAEALRKIKTWLERWVPFTWQESCAVTLNELIIETGFLNSLLLQSNGLQKVKNVEKVIQLIEQSMSNSLEEIVELIDERIELSDKEGEAEMERTEGDAVHIMTVHASKGLEFPIVCLSQLERPVRGDKGSVRFHHQLGIVMSLEEEGDNLNTKPEKQVTPGYDLVKDETSKEAEEEAKRLFYVAATRAKDYLVMIGEQPGAKKSWLYLVEDAKAEGELEHYLIEVDGVSEQQPHSPSIEHYTKAPLHPRKNVPVPLSVSEIMTFIHDPKEYYEDYVLGMNRLKWRAEVRESIGKEERKLDPTVVGTIVHRACELRDHGFSSSDAINEALLQIEDLPNTLLYQQEVEGLMDMYSEAQQEELGKPVANEWSFAVELFGAEVIGEIDKVVHRDGVLHLIDFKTNRIKNSGQEWLEVYDIQLYLYKMAYEKVTGDKITSMSLYVLRDKTQPLHTIVADKTRELYIVKMIERLVYLRQSNANLEEYVSLDF
ncbi:UvrD-helicase domain-containing protein [Alkalihalophilus lindianensis]|uniref:DNA 3'-5' helicase n=1 Tax=Alkalihalophilus lindianensis TaxID=1630542 RepID=A0ABU3XAL6_9BACI|nr:UvrD-helicase domain-containing protein [Alkalihalophilus lindianensis]MDV2684940.1 UvrD-helicase domain-containing protein [Alkalihalophilus lindianensis]